MRLIAPGKPTRRRALAAVALLAGLAGVLGWSARDRSGPWPVAQAITRLDNPLFFTHDGRTLVGGLRVGRDFAAIDLATGAERPIPREDLYLGDRPSPDGRLWLRHYFSGELRVVAATTGAEVRRLAADGHQIQPEFAPGGSAVLIFAGPQGHADEVRTWDLATGAVTRRPLGHPTGLVPGTRWGGNPIWFAGPDGRTIAYVDAAGGGVQLWDVAADRAAGGLLRTPTTAVHRSLQVLAFTPDGRFLLHGQPDGRVEVWDVARRALDRLLTVQTANDAIDSLIPGPDGRTLLVHTTPEARTLAAQGVRFAQRLLTPARARPVADETVLVEFPSGRHLARAPGGSLMTISPDGRTVALSQSDRVTIHRIPTADRP